MERAAISDAAAGRAWGPSASVTRWADQVVRRKEFERRHPDVRITHAGMGQPWIGVVPMPDGTEVTAFSRLELGTLLDKLELLVMARG
jgi:hypothetical protein